MSVDINALLAMVAHELRNPLSAITMSAAVLERGQSVTEGEKHARQVIFRQAAQLTRLVDDLLDVARAEQGTLELQKDSFDLHKLTTRVVARTHVVLMAPPHPIHFTGDPGRVEQMLMTLLEHAKRLELRTVDAHVELVVDATPHPSIGVTLVRQLAELHGGTLVGRTLRLPLS